MKMPDKAVVPQPEELDREFYRATVAAGALCMQHCKQCGTWTHPARYYCPNCSSGEFSFDKVSGDARVYSYTVSHVTAESAWKDLVPYITIVAELSEGPRIVAAADGFKPDTVAIGQPLRIVTENKTEDFAFFWAQRAEEKRL
jgi:uncharacterized OB-fold protein